jgi:two-component system, NarL family, invasion response regulator UvrY
MRILILDSNRLFGIGIKHFLLASFPESQVAHADCCVEARRLLEAEPYDLLLLDIGIDKDNGIRLLKRLRSDHPKLPLLVLSDYPADYHGPRAIRAGACGFIGKRSDPEELLRAVRCVLTGRYYISPELSDRLARGLGVGTDDETRHEGLSPREFQVFRRLALGETVSCIARALDPYHYPHLSGARVTQGWTR